MTHARWLDLVIVVAYMTGMALAGLRFSRRQTNTETYFVAKRAVSSWAMGLSMLATLISSVTFVAYPGSSYAKDWSLLVPGFLVLGVLILVGSVIIPFYRHAVGMSAYEYFQKRFGRPTRVYASLAFSLAHFSKMGFVFYLMALTINSITGFSIDWVILLAGAVMVFYTLIGGIEAVIWTDVIQAFLCGSSGFLVGGRSRTTPGQSAAVSPVAARPGTLMESVMPMEQELGACQFKRRGRRLPAVLCRRPLLP
jgi:SSS family solute:Na+ symporter